MGGLGHNDVAKVRALYTWIGGQQLVSHDWTEEVPEGSGLYRLVLVYSGQGTLSGLLADMCR